MFRHDKVMRYNTDAANDYNYITDTIIHDLIILFIFSQTFECLSMNDDILK